MARPINVLLVEDEPLTALNIERVLRRNPGIELITVAVDGREALDLLQGGTLEIERLVVLTDLSMPRLTGLELLAAIRADAALSSLPVVIFTTSNEGADRRAAFDLHASGYFVKASTLEHFEQILSWMAAYWCGSELAPASAA